MAFSASAYSAKLSTSVAEQGTILEITITGETGDNVTLSQATNIAISFNQGTDLYMAYAPITAGINSLDSATLFPIEAKVYTPSNAQLGNYQLQVFSDGYEVFKQAQAFTVIEGTPASITSVSAPENVERNSILSLTISGEGTHFAEDNNLDLYFYQGTSMYSNYSPAPIQVLSYNVLSDTKITTQIGVPLNTGTETVNMYLFGYLSGTMQFEDILNFSQASNIPSVHIDPKGSYNKQETYVLTVNGTNLNLDYEIDHKIVFSQGTNISNGYYSYYDFESDEYDSNTSEITGIIPAWASAGTYNVYYYNSLTGFVSTGKTIQVTNQIAEPKVKIAPAAGQPGVLDLEISAVNMQFNQASSIISIGLIGKNDSLYYSSSFDYSDRYSLNSTITIPEKNALYGSYDLFIEYYDYVSYMQVYENAFTLSKQLDEATVNQYVYQYDNYNNHKVIIDEALFDNAGLNQNRSYSVHLGDGTELPEWAQFDTATMTLSIQKERTKAWETVSITVIATDSEGKQAAYSFNTEVLFYETVSIPDYSYATSIDAEPLGFRLFPNPTSDWLVVSGIGKQAFNLVICDMTGNMVYQTISLPNTKLALPDLIPGIYTATVSTKDITFIQQISIN